MKRKHKEEKRMKSKKQNLRKQQTFIVGSVQNVQHSRRCIKGEMGTTSNNESGIFNTKDARK